MTVIRAHVMGYCMGVRRAVEIAERLLEGNTAASRVYTIGPLIHNSAAQEDLRRRGVEILDETDLPVSLENAAVIIRAHGVSPALEAELRARGAMPEDATCPKVKASQKKAGDLHGAGYTVFIAGEKSHGEIAGILGYAPGSIVVADSAEAEKEAGQLMFRFMYGGQGRNRCVLSGAPPVKTALLSQTTFSPEEFRAIAGAVLKYFPHTEIVDTICGAVQERQQSLRELCETVEVIIIAGSRDSANTRRLLALAESLGKKAWLVESPSAIPPEIAAYRTAGLSAGASAPASLIDAIEKALGAV